MWIPAESRRLATFGEISLCAGLGAIVEPYVLAYPRHHVLGICELTESARRDLLEALDACLATKLFSSGVLSVFEHGGCTLDETTACLAHCHLHVVDGQFDMVGALAAAYPEAEKAIIGTNHTITSESRYLFAGTYKGGAINGLIVHAPDYCSQFFRRRLASLTREEEWNWKVFPRPEAAIALLSVWPAQSADG
jgi:hypothetical protein